MPKGTDKNSSKGNRRQKAKGDAKISKLRCQFGSVPKNSDNEISGFDDIFEDSTGVIMPDDPLGAQSNDSRKHVVTVANSLGVVYDLFIWA